MLTLKGGGGRECPPTRVGVSAHRCVLLAASYAFAARRRNPDLQRSGATTALLMAVGNPPDIIDGGDKPGWSTCPPSFPRSATSGWAGARGAWWARAAAAKTMSPRSERAGGGGGGDTGCLSLPPPAAAPVGASPPCSTSPSGCAGPNCPPSGPHLPPSRPLSPQLRPSSLLPRQGGFPHSD
jgi:hypothetical protein